MLNRKHEVLPAIRTLIWVAVCSQAAFGQVNVLTYHNDNSRSGQNLGETILGPGRVTSSRFGKVLNVAMDGRRRPRSVRARQ